MNDTPEQDLDAALEDSLGQGSVRYIKRLVTAMTLTTIIGLVVLVGVVVMRFSQTSPQEFSSFPLPDHIKLPKDLTPTAVTFGDDWVAIIAGDEILVYDRKSGNLQNRVNLR